MRSSIMSSALTAAVFAVVCNTAVGAGPSRPVVCGANGCTRLTTTTLQGLLTLPRALRQAETPPAGPFLLFRVELGGATHRVVYVPREGGALLGFVRDRTWRRVPVDDAKLLADAARGRTPYPTPAAGTPLGELFAARDDPAPRHAAWLALAALVGLGVAGVAVYASVAAASRR